MGCHAIDEACKLLVQEGVGVDHFRDRRPGYARRAVLARASNTVLVERIVAEAEVGLAAHAREAGGARDDDVGRVNAFRRIILAACDRLGHFHVGGVQGVDVAHLGT